MERSGAIQRRMNLAIDRLVTATQHIRDCARCRRVFEATFEAIGQVDNAAHDFPETFPTAPNPWRVTNEALRDLRTCGTGPRELKIRALPFGGRASPSRTPVGEEKL